MTAETTADQGQAGAWGAVIARSWEDAALRERLLADPEAVAREQGIAVPAGLRLRAIAIGADEDCLVLPPVQAPAPADAATDEPLDAVLRRAQADPAYRARLTAEAAAVLREAGVAVPAGRTVRVLEEEEATGYLFVPPKPDEGDQATTDDVAGHWAGAYRPAGTRMYMFYIGWPFDAAPAPAPVPTSGGAGGSAANPLGLQNRPGPSRLIRATLPPA